MKPKLIAVSLFISCLLLAAQMPGLQAQPAASHAGHYFNQTVPTRTPTSAPTTPLPPPTSTPGSSNPPPTNPPAATATPTTESLPPTPEGGFLPTAAPCSDQPTVQGINYNSPVNIRQGPGTDYETVADLVYNEVRLIVGRSPDAPWWLIRLDGEQTGWVADEVVAVQGNTLAVPVVSAPPRNGATVTPGTPWQPTPPPNCVPTASPIPPTLTPSPRATGAGAEVLTVSPLEEVAATPATTKAYPATEPTIDTNVKPFTAVTPTATAIVLPTSIAALPPPTAATAGETAPPASGGPDFTLLLLAGAAGLLLLGAGAIFWKRTVQDP